MHHAIAGAHPLFHGQCIEVGFDGGSDLSFSGGDHVVFEILEIGAAYIGFHMACQRIHGHKAGTEKVSCGSGWSPRVSSMYPLPADAGKDFHLYRFLLEIFEDVRFAETGFFQYTIPVGLLHGDRHQVLYLVTHFAGVGCILLPGFFRKN